MKLHPLIADQLMDHTTINELRDCIMDLELGPVPQIEKLENNA